MMQSTTKYTAMEYNSAVDDFQDTEYPMLQGKPANNISNSI